MQIILENRLSTEYPIISFQLILIQSIQLFTFLAGCQPLALVVRELILFLRACLIVDCRGLPPLLYDKICKEKETQELNFLDLCMTTRLCYFEKTHTTINNPRSLRLKELLNTCLELFSSLFLYGWSQSFLQG